MDKDTIIEFNKVFEEEYLCERIKTVYKLLEKGKYESAIDLLSMIEHKAKSAIAFIHHNR